MGGAGRTTQGVDAGWMEWMEPMTGIEPAYSAWESVSALERAFGLQSKGQVAGLSVRLVFAGEGVFSTVCRRFVGGSGAGRNGAYAPQVEVPRRYREDKT